MLHELIQPGQFFFFFFWQLGFVFRASCLLGRCSYCLSHTLVALFCVEFFQDRVSQAICPNYRCEQPAPSARSVLARASTMLFQLSTSGFLQITHPQVIHYTNGKWTISFLTIMVNLSVFPIIIINFASFILRVLY
jgi:hypothetical protein